MDQNKHDSEVACGIGITEREGRKRERER